MKKTIALRYSLLSLSLLVFPGTIQAQQTCWTCLPDCYPNQQDEGWKGCKQGCDFRDFDRCGSDPEEIELDGVAVIGDLVTMDTHFELRGQFLADGVFAVRSCDGRQIGVVYSNEALAEREEDARVISFHPTTIADPL